MQKYKYYIKGYSTIVLRNHTLNHFAEFPIKGWHNKLSKEDRQAIKQINQYL